MISTPPQVAKTGTYSIGQTCEILDIHRQTLKRYTEAGYINARHRRVGSRIFYTGMEILRFWRVEINGAGSH